MRIAVEHQKLSVVIGRRADIGRFAFVETPHQARGRDVPFGIRAEGEHPLFFGAARHGHVPHADGRGDEAHPFAAFAIESVSTPELFPGGRVMPGQAISAGDEDLFLSVRADLRFRRGVALLGFHLRLRGPDVFPQGIAGGGIESEQVTFAIGRAASPGYSAGAGFLWSTWM